MTRIRHVLMTAMLILSVLVVWGQSKPFPQALTYPGCIKPNVSQSTLNSDVLNFYNYWKSTYLKKSTANPNHYYVAAGSTGGSSSAVTQSEAHGYGMVITALMAGADPNAKTYYDGLYGMYDTHRSANNNNLMQWQVFADEHNANLGSATDGDMDIAYSLLLAHYQWGSNGSINYLDAAKKMITNGLKASYVYSTLRLGLADDPTSDHLSTRPSDWMFDHMRAFKNHTNDAIWDQLAANLYNVYSQIYANYSQNTGLISDFVMYDPPQPAPPYQPQSDEGSTTGDFSYNACRTPLRLVMDFAHYGTTSPKTYLAKMVSWAKSTTGGNPTKFHAGYKLNGTSLSGTNYEAACFISPMIAAAVIDPANQQWVNDGWNYMKATRDTYYEDTYNMLCMLFVSGNWWIPQTTTTSNNPPSVSISAPSNGSTYTTGTYVTITANASDSDGSISNVQFFVDGSSIGTDATSPYSIAYTPSTGTHSITAVATDNSGSTTTSSAVTITVNSVTSSGIRVIGYMPTWMNFPGIVNTVDLSKLTHINIAFANPNTSGSLTGVNTSDIATVVNKAHANNVKVLVSIGGAGAPASTYHNLLSNSTNMTNFVNNLVNYAVNNNLDGIDVDIEGDVLDGSSVTKSQYQSFITQLASSLHAKNKIVTSAVATWYGDQVTNTTASKFDFISVMSYDAAIPGTGDAAAPHSPYSLATSDFGYWHNTKGVPGANINIGVPFYGYGWGSYAVSGNDEIAYSTIVNTYSGAENKDVIGSGSNAIYYNGIPTIKQKTTYAVQNAGGVMIWELAEDVTDSRSLLLAIDQVIHGTTTNIAPSISITAPANGATYTTGATVTITANASDSDGSVSSVQFFVDGSSIGTDNSSPYSVNYTASVGSHSITTKATDNSGASTTSSAVSITVTNPVTQSPYGGTPWAIPGKIEAENYDLGGEGVAYHDATTANEGGSYRQDAVDIEAATEGGYDVGWTANGEWLEYTVNVTTAGTYKLDARVAAIAAGSYFHVEMDGQNISGIITVPNTGDWQAWQTVSITTTSLTVGQKVMRIVMDAAGFNLNNVTFSSTIVTNTPPTVSITSPANGTGYTTGATVTITATASDSDGSVSKVEFFADGQSAGVVTGAPYTISYTAVAGTHSITAKATDNSGATTTSTSVSITVTDPVTQAAYGGTPWPIPGKIEAEDYDTGGEGVAYHDATLGNSGNAYRTENVDIEATTDAGGGYNIGWVAADEWLEYTVNVQNTSTYKFELRVASIYSGKTFRIEMDGQNVTGTVTVPNTGSWQTFQTVTVNNISLTAGQKVMRVYFITNDINLNYVNTIDVGNNTQNQLPTASITSPANNATYTSPASITINAAAADADGSISKVDFYNGTTLLGTDNSSPYSYSWTNVPAGTYSITTVATDNQGGQGTSSAVTVKVNAPTNMAPTVAITSPENNATFNAPVSITIVADASDSDGSVSQVDFYSGSTLLNSDNSSPYSYSWSNVATGTYTIKATAIDNQGATKTATITVTVNASTNGCTGIPQYVENGGYVDGSKVQNAGGIYQCKPYPYTGWCNGAAWAYGPGTGSYWTDAWDKIGSCTAKMGSFNNTAATKAITVYPNPTTEVSQLKLNVADVYGGDVQVTNSLGEEVYKGKLDINLQSTIDLKGLKSGIYMIKVSSEGNVWFEKLVKQ